MNTRRTLHPSNNGGFNRLSLSLRIVVSLLMLAPVLARHVAAQDQMPKTMTYQGYLTDTDGDPANGTTTVVFRLYEQSSGGTALWEETQQGVLFTDGVFSAHLGSVESLDDVPFGRALWLGVSVAGSQELAPRVALEAVPYALSVRGLRVVPSLGPTPSPSLIGGSLANSVDESVAGAVIAGGGGEEADAGNRILSNGTFATISGGAGNRASENFATISGGEQNEAEGRGATVGGGRTNKVLGDYATVGGGEENEASGLQAFIGGGSNNDARGEQAVIGGGFNNEAREKWATVGGGWNNKALGIQSVVSGGDNNLASGIRSIISGGGFNEARGVAAIVAGGQTNVADGDNSFAAGFNAHADHDGSFVWADYFNLQDPPFSSTGTRQFLIRAQGGVGIGTNAPQGTLHVVNTDETLDIDTGDFSQEALVVEGFAPVIGIYAAFQSNTRPGLVLAGVDNGNVVDKWSIVREFFSGNALHFTYGLNEDHTQNPSLMTLSNAGGGSSLSVPDGIVLTGQLRATDSLGSSATPFQGSVYQDNIVYAWAHVQFDGSVTASYGCTVSKSATGSYTVSFKRQLPNGASAIVTPQTLNDPVIATAVASANQASVVTKVFNGTAFVPFDSGFYIQVVGRP